jgi:hypothetical protein
MSAHGRRALEAVRYGVHRAAYGFARIGECRGDPYADKRGDQAVFDVGNAPAIVAKISDFPYHNPALSLLVLGLD